MKPHKCPVCEGRGYEMHLRFINISDQVLYKVSCIPCHGMGIVWELEKGDRLILTKEE